MKKSVIFKSLFFLLCCLCVFMLVGTAAFNLNVRPIAVSPQESIPKQSTATEPLGILIFDDELNGALVAFLNFDSTTTQLVLLKDKNNLSFCAYPINRKIKVSSSSIKEIVDFIGGITLAHQNTSLRYTGTQVSQILYQNNGNYDISEIILQIFFSLSSKADKEFFLFLINNTISDISYIDFFNCKDVLANTLLNCVITVQE